MQPRSAIIIRIKEVTTITITMIATNERPFEDTSGVAFVVEIIIVSSLPVVFSVEVVVVTLLLQLNRFSVLLLTVEH